MIAKIIFFISCVAATYSTAILESGVVAPVLINSGIVAPGLVNSRIVAPGILKSGVAAPGILTSGYVSSGLAFNDVPVIAAPVAAVEPSAITASSVVSTPGTIARDNRVIGSTGMLTATPIISSGAFGTAPSALNRAIVSPTGLRNTGILAGPGTIKTLQK